jgi:D-proline reductase (dithiol) PrdB
MARLEDIPLGERNMMLGLDCSGFEGRRPWVTGPKLRERRIALLSTAALNLRSDAGFLPNETHYRMIPGHTAPGEVVMSHGSANFDRTGFQQDLNVCFPLQRLQELAADGVIGSVANVHFTVSGGRAPLELEDAARDMARRMRADGVDTVFLVPI